jgi:hypothetical protein
VVQACLGSHFVDGSGVYNFKSNLWLGGAVTPDYDWEACDVDGFKLEFDLEAVQNRFRVQYNSGPFATRRDVQSIIKYGQRDYELSNDLIKNVDDATELAGILNSLQAFRVKGCEFELKNRIPEIFNIKIGTVIRFTEPKSGLTDVDFVVYGINRKVGKAGDHEVTLRCKRRYSGPYIYYISSRTSTVGVNSNFAIAQSFYLPDEYPEGILWRIECKVTNNFYSPNACYLQLTNDIGGFPGTQLMLYNAGFQDDGVHIVDASLVTGLNENDALITHGKKFWIVLFYTALSPGENFNVWGTNPGDYPLGNSAYQMGGGGWINEPAIDRAFNLKIYPK